MFKTKKLIACLLILIALLFSWVIITTFLNIKCLAPEPKLPEQHQWFDTLHEPSIMWPIEDNESDSKAKMVLVLVVVCSAVGHFEERKTIRDTWGKVEYINLELFANVSHRVEVIFLVGVPNNTDDTQIQNKIDIESNTNKDILQQNFIDDYMNLTLKSIAMLRWATEHSKFVKLLMKVDDDVFLNVYNLMTMVINKGYAYSESDLLVGYVNKHVMPIQNSTSKWYCPKNVYKECERYYPNYLGGPGYLMSVTTASKLYQAAQTMPTFFLEDVFITGVCAVKAKINRRHYDEFFSFQRSRYICNYVYNIVSHEGSNIRDVYISPNDTINFLDYCIKRVTFVK